MSASSSDGVAGKNPFVGPRPLGPNDRLYGREREIAELGYRLHAERVVLLHSPSGAGKSSLIQAGLLPELRSSFDVCGPTRVNEEPVDARANRYVASAIAGFEEGLPEAIRRPPADLAGHTVASYFAVRPRQRSLPDRLLVFDQFEEILTVDPLATTAKEEFFDQLGELLRDRQVWALLVLREDYLAPLDPYAWRLPTQLENRFRIDLLDRGGALQVMVRTAGDGDRAFPAASKLADDLAIMKVQQPDGSFVDQKGQHVEPVQLQVVCRRLWDAMPAEDLSIDPEDLVEFGDVDTALGVYFADSVHNVTAEDPDQERAIREWFDDRLITGGGIRAQVQMGEEASGGLANELIARLLDSHLIRAEQRAGATWYELAHDRLIEPVRESNERWFKAELQPVQRKAKLWQRQGEPSGLLIKDQELAAAERWAADAPSTEVERRFLEKSREAQDAAERERRQTRKVKRSAVLAVTAAVLALVAAVAAGLQWREALLNERVTQATLLDARAAGRFAQSRRIEARRAVEVVRLRELLATLQALEDTGQSLSNIELEAAQLRDDLREAGDQARSARTRGRELLSQAGESWDTLAAEGHDPAAFGRIPAEPPYIFSIELINARYGECLLVHYGTPDDLRLVMIDAGPRSSYRNFIERRLRDLGELRFGGGPVPIELFIVGDRDESKTGGLLAMLEHLAEVEVPEERVVDLQGIWANIFRVDGSRGLRPRIRRLIDDLGVPLNRPFDRLVVRPEEGRLVVPLAGGLEIVVLGPTLEAVRYLYERLARRDAEKQGLVIEPFPNEGFSEVEIERWPAGLEHPGRPGDPGERCRPSESARALAGGSYQDRSPANLASTVVLFRYRGKTFLFTGDARGDHILDGLASAGLLYEEEPAYIDVMSIPHLGSDRNITLDFFERLQAESYLFSGNGRHGNPDVATIASLIAARGCDRYRMWFGNREDREGRGGAEGEQGARFDDFFAKEAPFAQNYRRVFRSTSRGSIIVDLLEPVRD